MKGELFTTEGTEITEKTDRLKNISTDFAD